MVAIFVHFLVERCSCLVGRRKATPQYEESLPTNELSIRHWVWTDCTFGSLHIRGHVPELCCQKHKHSFQVPHPEAYLEEVYRSKNTASISMPLTQCPFFTASTKCWIPTWFHLGHRLTPFSVLPFITNHSPAGMESHKKPEWWGLEKWPQSSFANTCRF